jgi:prepilin-type N-terminal cleavage/methylation domain-containing protein
VARKYTILKQLIQNSSKVHKSNQGFTLIELIVGLSIMLIVGSLAMNAFIQASTTFNQDKKSIDSSQNMSAILELIGIDIKQAGEGINESMFPVIEFGPDPDSTTNPKSSKITIRRGLITQQLTLCKQIPANASSPTSLIVADNDPAITDGNCKTDPMSPTPSPDRPKALRLARNYRCHLDDLAPYKEPDPDPDLCLSSKPSPDLEKVRAVVSDGAGHIRKFNYTDDNEDVANSKYSITVEDMSSSDGKDGIRNNASIYDIGSAIYLIEERVYTLTKDNDNPSNFNLMLSIDGGPPTVLVKKIAKFGISARLYSDKTTKDVAAAPVDPCTTASTQFVPNPQYTCKFNANTASADPAYDWKTIAGVKVELQAQYDSTGQKATPTASDTEKLTAKSEFFPRNVLSK